MKPNLLILAAAAVLAAGMAWLLLRQGPTGPDPATASAEAGAPMVAIALPAALSAEAQMGKRAFEATCVTCHGENATGRQGMGPPLIHKTYEPGHHADMAFHLAVQNGVRSHHWRFGDMPPVAGLTPTDVARIVTYVREVQRENGID